MEEEVKGISEYLEILKRHKKIVIYPAIFLILVSAAVALLLPATYKSTGLILIEAQEIPIDLVRSTVTSYADQRIAVIKQKLMTTSRVMGIVKKYHLYPETVKKSAPSVIVGLFRQNMSVDMVQANVTDPRSGRSKRANIAFNVSFMDEDPVMAQKIANELTTQFLNENVKTRTARANETRAFLKEEGDKFQRKIQSLEKKIADFKEEFNDSLPELLPYNLSMVEKLQEQLVTGQNNIMVLKDQIMTMSLELANLDALLPSVGSQQAASPAQQLSQAKAQYAALQDKYSESHPDIKRLKRQIKSLEKQLGTNAAKKTVVGTRYKSPLLLKINSKIDSSEREIKRIQVRRKIINGKLNEFEKRVAETHQVKRAYEDLVRDYQNNLAKYQELRAKELQAELAQNLESENKGESFTLIEPPLVPNKPEKPNRPKIFLMGVVASIGIGVGLALLFEILVGGVRGYNELTRIVGAPPLVVVPLITVKSDGVNATQSWYVKIYKAQSVYVKLYWLAGLIIIVMLGVHFFVMDLEIIWFKVLRKISML
ncbi:MAG: sugar transporter [Cycloclasticus sp.]|nr:sugar transporter [Cycloclasticus sp.]